MNGRIHPAVIFGLLVDAVVAAFAWAEAPLLGEVMAALWLMAVVGAVLMAARRPKLGSRLIMIGSLAFLPVGLLAAWGAVRTTDEIEERAFLARRAGQ